MMIAGVIIAGGKSSRMGGREKALLPLAGKPLIQHVIERVRPQVDCLAINANGDAARFAAFNLPVIADRRDTGTPLAGLEAAMQWAAGIGAGLLLTIPSDSPDLPDDLTIRLQPFAPAIAASGGQPHYLTGLWPLSLRDTLHDAIEAHGMRAVKDFVRLAKATRVEWVIGERDPFLNLNTPEDLEAACIPTR